MRRLIVPLSTIWLLLVTTLAGAEPKVTMTTSVPRAGQPGRRDA
jgi:hypothetical protein